MTLGALYVEFSRPTLSELIVRMKNGTLSRLTFDQLRRSDAEVYSKIMAGASHELHGHLQFISEQVIYDTAVGSYLDRWSTIWLKVPRKAPEKSVGVAGFTGDDGKIVYAGSALVALNGAEYETTIDAIVVGGVVSVAVKSIVGGVAGNQDANSLLSLVTTIDGVSSTVTVDADGLTGGADLESDDSLRDRLLARIQEPPHGGAAHDYKAWALEVAGVSRAWVYPGEMGDGTVSVRFVRDGDASIIPAPAEVDVVQDYIDNVRPVTAKVYVAAPIPDILTLSIALSPDTPAIRAAVQAEFDALLDREAEPGKTILLSHIREAISISAGENDHDMTLPAADVTHTTGHIPVTGPILWL